MTVFHAIYLLLIGPLELIFEYVFAFAKQLLGSMGLSILAMSLCMNFLLLPLYRQADAIQDEERAQTKRMSAWVDHIKKTFSGNERFMLLQTYYRQNGYKPYYALRGMLPLLLEVPFFIAAYHFLSHLSVLSGASFGPIADLGRPDGLLKLGTWRINLLPILMTAINIVSGAIYTKGLPLKDKLQLYGMALVFLVLLYGSPAGLVVYWTMNNLFSLIKNLCRKLPKRAKRAKRRWHLPEGEPSFRLFFSGCLFLALLTGALIPSAVINASAQEFVFVKAYRSPLWYIISASLLSAGTFLIWLGLLYYLCRKSARRVLGWLVWVLSGMAVVNYMLFGKNLGMINSELIYETEPAFTVMTKLLNAAALLGSAGVLTFVWRKNRRLVQAAYAALCIAAIGMSAANVRSIRAQMPPVRKAAEEYQLLAKQNESIHFTLSRDGKNVVVIMLDRAISAYIPYMFAEMPELEETFAGFTYYPNTLSHGITTMFGTPSLFGGYEYTPAEINSRADEKLADKQNEALRVMPLLFDDAGYEVTVFDPVYAGYQWIPDLSIYNDRPDIEAYHTDQGQLNTRAVEEQASRLTDIWERDFFLYSLMKISPCVLQPVVYQDGTYDYPDPEAQAQMLSGMSQAEGVNSSFEDSYAALLALPSITRISDEAEGGFLMMVNSTTHEPTLLQEPEYEPAVRVDNREYDAAHADRFTVNGRTMLVENEDQMKHYQTNMAALLRLGEWLNYLREAGVYDNTRIIIVSDHGRSLHQFEDLRLGHDAYYEDVMAFNPLLLVKDFDSTEFTTDNRFMTLADVPTLALAEVVEDPVNPATGKPITDEAKHGTQRIIVSDHWNVATLDNDYVFKAEYWYDLSGENIFDLSNWTRVDE